MSLPFAHLHCHSHYSLLDGASSIKKLIQRTTDHGMNALALTDHGNLHGALEFYRAAKAAHINPIIGYEAYVAPGSRFDKGRSGFQDNSFHLTLLAQNRTGFKNLVKMASAASLEGFYFKPRIDRELLETYNEGIVCLSGCASSQFSRAILRGGNGGEESLQAAREIAEWFASVFGDRYYIEIMNNGVEIQQICLQASVDIANRLGIPLVATSDCHYIDPEDAEVQDVMLCINTGRFLSDTNRMRLDGQEYYLRSPQQMYEKFPDLEDAVARSQEIADSVEINLELGKRHFPKFSIENDQTPESYLRDLCIRGLRQRYQGNEKMMPGSELSPEVMARLDRELSVIEKLGFPNYFLIVWDFVREARSRGIPTTARGSGVGALVCYALFLSHVCPIEHKLLFERFLDENRLEAPDIDIDFCKERRGEIINYVKQVYGEQNVAQIGTFGTMAARAAIKDVGRVMGLPLTQVNQITALIPDQPGISIAEAIEANSELSNLIAKDQDIRRLIDFARKLEGLARNVGTHAAAVVIGDKPLTEYLPLGKVPGKDDVITQWSMNDVEDAGLLKMDFLGLKNLTVLSKAVELIETTTGTRLNLDGLPMDDQETFKLLQRGETKGVFQLESGGIRDLLQKMKPDHFRDIIATNAMYRPGPLEGGMVEEYVNVKLGRKSAEFKHPVLKEILEETHGVMVYQEQVMQILNRLGNIPLAAAYTCIKAISKKKQAIIEANREKFIDGAVNNGLSQNEAANFWEMINKFAGYGFNKSHSTAYALIAYQTAYLKCHYPLEYMAAVLTGDIPGRNFTRKDSLVEHLEDAKRMDIEIVPPHVNASGVEFTVASGKIHFALTAIKGCGTSTAEAIVHSREKKGPFKDLFDFCERIDTSECSRSTVESLIKAGAMDDLGGHRAQLLQGVDRALVSGAAAQSDRRRGQKTLFDAIEDEQEAEPANLPDAPEMQYRDQLTAEKDVLGFYLSGHPLADHAKQLTEFCTHPTNRLNATRHRDPVIMGGMISAIKPAHVKKPKSKDAPTKYVNFDLEDLQGTVRCILWPGEYVHYGHLVQNEAIVLIHGAIDKGAGDEANLIAKRITPVNELDSLFTGGLCLHVREARADGDLTSPAGSEPPEKKLQTIFEILRGYPGDKKVEMVLELEDGVLVKTTCHKLKIDISDELRTRLVDALGQQQVQNITAPPSAASYGPPSRSRQPK